jgi:acylphosphatase
VIIAGRVQGVFFRDTCRRLAREVGLAGWVRNNPDGRVEACFEGEGAGVDRLVDWCRSGPRGAVVERVEVHEDEPQGLEGFRVR